MNKTKHIVLLLAGGCGQRMHSDCPKQFIEIDGIPIILHTMRAFQKHEWIDKIYVVCAPEWKDFITAHVQDEQINKFAGTFPAGETSFKSLCNGIDGLTTIYGKYEGNPTVLVHEAVRPLISHDIITQNIQVSHSYGNAITAIRSNEAYMISQNGTYSEESMPRETLFRAQTPQTFPLHELTDLFKEAERKGIKDSQSLFTLVREIYPHKPLYISQGNELNFKITHPEDAEILRAILVYRRENE